MLLVLVLCFLVVLAAPHLPLHPFPPSSVSPFISLTCVSSTCSSSPRQICLYSSRRASFCLRQFVLALIPFLLLLLFFFVPRVFTSLCSALFCYFWYKRFVFFGSCSLFFVPRPASFVFTIESPKGQNSLSDKTKQTLHIFMKKLL